MDSLLGGEGEESGEAEVREVRDEVIEVELIRGPVYFKNDSIIAARGNLDFSATKPIRSSGGIMGLLEKVLKAKMLGMKRYFVRVDGSGVLYAGDGGKVRVLEVPEGEHLTVNQDRLLFTTAPADVAAQLDASVLSTGLIDIGFEGPCKIVVTSECDPVTVKVDGDPVYVDPECLIAWSGDLTFSATWKGSTLDFLLGREHGEEFLLEAHGYGEVLVAPYDERIRRLERMIRRAGVRSNQGVGGSEGYEEEGYEEYEEPSEEGGLLDDIFDLDTDDLFDFDIDFD
ncbi:AIM24 family protein [Methanopyrus sp. KOL6]|uniref:AIM24 family protein n=1 Tax=Methanopyrus sp. KOL6 TaxID=1937004 RepID=UPI0012FC5E00|nr:AIM24 family protein [Methanopyrus sp. KOL6]